LEKLWSWRGRASVLERLRAALGTAQSFLKALSEIGSSALLTKRRCRYDEVNRLLGRA